MGLLEFSFIRVANLRTCFRVDPFEKQRMATGDWNRDDTGTFVAMNLDDTFGNSFDQIQGRLCYQYGFLILLGLILPPVNRRDGTMDVRAGSQASLDQVAANRYRFRRIARGYVD